VPQLLNKLRIDARPSGLTARFCAPSRSRFRVFDAPYPLRLWHLASLDAPSVALVWSFGFAWVARATLPVWLQALLAFTVWAVYIADRLLDARAGLRSANPHRLRERHLFHWRHRRLLLPLAAAAAAAAASIVFTFMPLGARETDSILAAASLVYFVRVHTGRKPAPLLSKELLVGLLFTAGCALPALARLSTRFSPRFPSPAALPHPSLLWPMLVTAAFFALLAWLNCHAIDRWEALSRWEALPHHPFNRSIAPTASLVALAGLLLTAVFCISQPRFAALLAAAAAAALLLALLDSLRSRLTPVALRAAADLVLLTPLLLLPFAASFK
jgi:hypothetical protein